MSFWINENMEDDSKKSANSSTAAAEVKGVNNKIYFYSAVSDQSILKLQEAINAASAGVLNYAHLNSILPASVHIHINSGGGSLFAGFAAMDIIARCPVPTISLVEGRAASAATLMSLSAKKRLITPHSYMLIHQLSSGMWGTYENFKDHTQNIERQMEMIRNLYLEKTKLTKKILNELLKHDLYFEAKECIKMGLADEIYE